MMRPADRAWTSSGFDARGRAGLAEQALEVNCRQPKGERRTSNRKKDDDDVKPISTTAVRLHGNGHIGNSNP